MMKRSFYLPHDSETQLTFPICYKKRIIPFTGMKHQYVSQNKMMANISSSLQGQSAPLTVSFLLACYCDCWKVTG